VLITVILVAAVLLILFTGAGVYYRIKVAFAAQSGAKTGADRGFFLGAVQPGVSPAQRDADAVQAVKDALSIMGLPAADNIVPQVVTAPSGKQFYQVEVDYNGIKLVAGSLPAVPIKEVAAISITDQTPPGVLGLTFAQSPNGIGFYIPVYGPGSPAGFGPVTFPLGPTTYYAGGVQSAASNSILPGVPFVNGSPQ
jgi:hypothetical protein